jgi:predicted nucleotidyltransferase component of viral defense system
METHKRVLSPQHQLLLREVLQTATLAALMDSRRWEPGDIAFQGGTSLHLAHGSARFSEDLDFMVRGGLSLDGLSKQVQKKLRLPPDIPSDLRVTVTPGKDHRNPHMFYVTLSGPQVLGSAKVKVELWRAQADALQSLRLKISTVTSPAGQAFVPTLTLSEIFADKVYALGARARIKPRDVFDLWWLCEKEKPQLTAQALHTRLEIYPVPSGITQDTATVWLANAAQRLQELKAPHAAQDIAGDLKRWLPSSWPMHEQTAAPMLAVSITQLQAGMALMQGLAVAQGAP